MLCGEMSKIQKKSSRKAKAITYWNGMLLEVLFEDFYFNLFYSRNENFCDLLTFNFFKASLCENSESSLFGGSL